MAESIWDFLTSRLNALILLATVLLFEGRSGLFSSFSRRWSALPTRFAAAFLCGAFLAAGILLPFDQTLIDAIQRIEVRWLRSLMDFGGTCGHMAVSWSILAVAYWLAVAFRSTAARRMALGCLLSSALTALLGHILKHVVARARPVAGFGPAEFFHYANLFDNGDFLSFPGGDVAVSAGIASFLVFALRTPLKYLVLVVPVLTALERMHLNKHWPSDVTFSFVVSFAFGRVVHEHLRALGGGEPQGATSPGVA